MIRYLDFGIGKGIGSSCDPGTGNDGVDHESEAAAGLEEVAEFVHDDYSVSYESIVLPTDLRAGDERERDTPRGTYKDVKEVSKDSYGYGCPPVDSEEKRSCKGSFRGNLHPNHHEPCYYYGAVSDKVGEAAACWLTRWGIDMLRYEEHAGTCEPNKQRSVPWSLLPTQRERSGSAPPEMTEARLHSRSIYGKPDVVPVIWRRGGLSARWVRGILSSDELFVGDEKERYEMAKSVVEMRRAARATDPDTSGESHEEQEQEFDQLFKGGIYYANMVSVDLSDVCLTSTDQLFIACR